MIVAGSLIVLVVCAAILLVTVLGGGLFLLVKLGVIFKEAARPSVEDRSSYSLDQGREVRPEEDT